MATKTKKSNRGRPRKDFSNMKIKKEESNIKRPRGRPRKEKKLEETVNTKISKHSTDISKLSKANEKIQLEISNANFSSRKVGENKKSNNFALGLLIFSMLLFIFSLYKTFYSSSIQSNIISDGIVYKQINENTKSDKQELETKIVEYEVEKKDEAEKKDLENKKPADETEEDAHEFEIINTFYNTLNNKEFSELSKLVDSYLKSSNVYRTYYSNNWLNKFTERLANKKVYLLNIKEINLENKKEGVKYYSYILRYKLNDSNELFTEEREASVITRGDKKLIGSLHCITVGCSKMPFFNLPRYEK